MAPQRSPWLCRVRFRRIRRHTVVVQDGGHQKYNSSQHTSEGEDGEAVHPLESRLGLQEEDGERDRPQILRILEEYIDCVCCKLGTAVESHLRGVLCIWPTMVTRTCPMPLVTPAAMYHFQLDMKLGSGGLLFASQHIAAPIVDTTTKNIHP